MSSSAWENAARHIPSGRILAAARQATRDTLILVALGPAGKLLVSDLHGIGYQVIDVGHLDIEYEWFLRKVTREIRVSGKYVNEVDPEYGGFDGDDRATATLTANYRREVTARSISGAMIPVTVAVHAIRRLVGRV